MNPCSTCGSPIAWSPWSHGATECLVCNPPKEEDKVRRFGILTPTGALVSASDITREIQRCNARAFLQQCGLDWPICEPPKHKVITPATSERPEVRSFEKSTVPLELVMDESSPFWFDEEAAAVAWKEYQARAEAQANAEKVTKAEVRERAATRKERLAKSEARRSERLGKFSYDLSDDPC